MRTHLPSAIFYLLCTLCALAQTRPGPRIEVNIHATNQATALTFINTVSNQLAGNLRTNDPRLLEVRFLRTNGGSFTFIATVPLTSSNQAEAVFTRFATNAKPAQLRGTLSIHYCPTNGDPRFRDWAGCRDDPRANHREVTFP